MRVADPFCAAAGLTSTGVVSHVLTHPPGELGGLSAGHQKYRLHDPRVDHRIHTFPDFRASVSRAYEQEPTNPPGLDDAQIRCSSKRFPRRISTSER